MPKKVSKKGPKKGPKKDQYYSLKQKSEGHFSVPKKKRARSDRPTSTEDLKSVQDACTLAENRENLDTQQTDRHMFWKRSGGRNKRCAQKVLNVEY